MKGCIRHAQALAARAEAILSEIPEPGPLAS